MNIMFFLTPKNEVAYLYNDDTVRQGMEKLRAHGYTAVPIIDHKGRYVSTITEGDFLRWLLLEDRADLHAMERVLLSEIHKDKKFDAYTIDTDIEDLFQIAMRQNYVPVVDDKRVFIGIVTRKEIIHYSTGRIQKLQSELESTKNELESTKMELESMNRELESVK